MKVHLVGVDSERRQEAAVQRCLQDRKITANDANTARGLGVPRKGSGWVGNNEVTVAAVPKSVVQIEIEC